MNQNRRTHRKRVSALRLSSDTTATLPEYYAPHPWHSETPSDLPPDYPDSAEEADEDTASDDASNHPSPLPPISPRRTRRFLQHRRRPSAVAPPSSDLYLDSLLERSVHALEMSNALLQSSQSTSAPSIREVNVPYASSSRPHEVHHAWADDLEEIRRGVEGLFDDDTQRSGHSRREGSWGSISSSLPTTSLIHQNYGRRRPSLDLREAAQAQAAPHLRLEPQARNRLVSPPPRALTQYVASSSDADTIVLPSTLGLRSSSSQYQHPSTFHASLSSPSLTDRPIEPSTPAYNMLSSLVKRSNSTCSSAPSQRQPSSSFLRRHSAERGGRHTSPYTSPSSHSSSTLPDRRSRSNTPKRMTPPPEELSSSSSDSCHPKQTISALRRILDELPPPAPKPKPAFLIPKPPEAEAGTSTATASVSRLFTKPTHSTAAAGVVPKRSSLKAPSMPSTPTVSSSGGLISKSSSLMSVSEMFRVGGGGGSGSGRSTPKRISFAELPESTGSSSARRRARKGKKKKVHEDEGGGGWLGWLFSPSAAGTGVDRMEDKMGRRWGGAGLGAGGFDEWAV